MSTQWIGDTAGLCWVPISVTNTPSYTFTRKLLICSELENPQTADNTATVPAPQSLSPVSVNTESKLVDLLFHGHYWRNRPSQGSSYVLPELEKKDTALRIARHHFEL